MDSIKPFSISIHLLKGHFFLEMSFIYCYLCNLMASNEKRNTMDAKLQSRLVLLNSDLSKLLEELKNYSEEDLNRPPKPGAWSALQVMHHLMLSEELGHQYIEKKLSFNPTLKNKGVMSSLRFRLLSLYLGSPFKFKAPDIIGDEALPVKSSFWETAKKWKAQRTQLESFLDSLPEAYANKEIYKHPAAGRLTLSHMVRFYHDHFRRHRKQIRKALIFPPSRHK